MDDVLNTKILCYRCSYFLRKFLQFKNGYCMYHERETSTFDSCDYSYEAEIHDKDIDMGFLEDDDKEKEE